MQLHKINKLEFAPNKIDASGEYYQTQYKVIHIDEMNFHVDKKTRRVYVGNREVLPYRLHQNANYIQKVMFLAAIARLVKRFPNVDPQNQQWDWDGKIGLDPLVEEHFARRGDNQTGLQQGDQILALVIVTSAYFESIILEKLLPDIV
jgi:hypothetical protein